MNRSTQEWAQKMSREQNESFQISKQMLSDCIVMLFDKVAASLELTSADSPSYTSS